MAASSRQETLCGYFLSPNQQFKEEDDEDEDVTDDEEWKDFDDLSSGSSGHGSKPLKREKCEIRNLKCVCFDFGFVGQLFIPDIVMSCHAMS